MQCSRIRSHSTIIKDVLGLPLVQHSHAQIEEITLTSKGNGEPMMGSLKCVEIHIDKGNDCIGY